MSKSKVYEFKGEAVNVTWDGRLCIHIAECGQSEGDLFVGGRNPWCMPDKASQEEVFEICERCPSGSLTYSTASGQQESASGENTVNVAYNGPLFVKGELDIEGAPEDMPGTKFRAALCRCGQSKNKPFCDNSHLQADFEDYAAVGEKGPGTVVSGGKLTIKALQDGPLLLSGNVTIIAGSGRKAWQGDNTALCRCGASKNKPFCDGSHKSAGFKSE